MKTILCLVPALLLSLGCSTTLPSRVASSGSNETTATAAPRPEQESAVVAVSQTIRDACGIDESQAYFAYDSADVTLKDSRTFRDLAACFAAGPLKDRRMDLVGHADGRGEADYNYLLGQRRADSVKGAIVQAGLEQRRISTTSRGENEAVGQDEPGWAKDRRVDVVLGGLI